jgi:hypothetical protein
MTSEDRNFEEPTVTLEEFRTDGYKVQTRRRIYGSLLGRQIDEKDATYQSSLWDGKDYYYYGIMFDVPDNEFPHGSVTLNKNPDSPSNLTRGALFNSASSPIFGYHFQDTDRLDIVLKQSDKLNVSTRKENIGEHLCYVLNADGANGKYRVWLDPDRDYCVVRLQFIKTQGHKAFPHQYQLRGQDKINHTVDVKELVKIDDIWIPRKLTSTTKRVIENGEFLFSSQSENEVLDVVVNPDHDALNSFKPDDIRNGAVVVISEFPWIFYTWMDGELLPKIDETERTEKCQ